MKNLWNHLLTALSGAYLEFLLRVLAIAPVYCALTGVTFFGMKVSPVLWCAVSAALYAVLVMPARAFGYMGLRRIMGGTCQKPSYGRCLRFGLGRLLKGTVWGIAFWALFIYFVWGYNSDDSLNVFLRPMMRLGALITRDGGHTMDKGMAMFFAGMLLALLIYAFGWWLDTAGDYLDISSPAPLKTGRLLFRKHKGLFIRKAFIQGLILLPSAALLGFVLFDYARREMNMSGGVLSAVASVGKLIRQPVPGSVVMYLAAVLLVVHVPLCLVRKASMARLVLSLEDQA